jgi:N-acylneuraminate cytidylyltransferase
MRIAIITARGGSKRIPRKNIKHFCGKPIIQYSIEAALRSDVFDTVMVSTDDVEIAEISIAAGAEVPFYRSSDTSNDFATTADVLLEVLEEYRKLDRIYNRMCCIYPTAPFLTNEHIRTGLEQLEKSGADAVIPVVKFSYPPQRAFIIKDRKLQFQFPEYAKMRSQDLTSVYHDIGQFYWYSIDSFLANNGRLTGNCSPLIMPDTIVQDIDTADDWQLAEIKYRVMKDMQL